MSLETSQHNKPTNIIGSSNSYKWVTCKISLIEIQMNYCSSSRWCSNTYLSNNIVCITNSRRSTRRNSRSLNLSLDKWDLEVCHLLSHICPVRSRTTISTKLFSQDSLNSNSYSAMIKWASQPLPTTCSNRPLFNNSGNNKGTRCSLSFNQTICSLRSINKCSSRCLDSRSSQTRLIKPKLYVPLNPMP